MTNQFEVSKIYYGGIEILERIRFSRIIARFPDGTVQERKIMIWSDNVECLESDTTIRADDTLTAVSG